MIGQWISNLTPKRIIISSLIIIVSIYVVLYVIDALDGFDPNFKPAVTTATSGAGVGSEIKGGIEIFDPTAKTPEPDSSK
jgi:hypothetical protein